MAFPHGIAGPERPPDGGWMGVHIQPSPMPCQASKEGGRSGHGRKLRSGTADPVAGVQPQSSQRHTEPLARTSRRRFRAHAPRCRCARAVRHRPPAIGGQVPPPESLSVAAAENDLESWLRTRESRSIRLGGSRTGTGLRVFALVGRTGSPTSMSPPTPLVKKPFAPQVSDAQIVQSIIERGIE